MFSLRTHSQMLVHLQNAQPQAREIQHCFFSLPALTTAGGAPGWHGEKGGTRERAGWQGAAFKGRGRKGRGEEGRVEKGREDRHSSPGHHLCLGLCKSIKHTLMTTKVLSDKKSTWIFLFIDTFVLGIICKHLLGHDTGYSGHRFSS